MANPAVERTIQVLEFLATQPGRGFTLSELSRHLGISLSTAHSILGTLTDRGWLTRNPDNLEYRLGVALVPVGAAAERNFSALTDAKREVKALAEEFDCECIVVATTLEELIHVGRAGTGGPFSVTSRDGQRYPLAPPLGSSLIAWMGNVEVEAWLARFGGELTEAELEHYRGAVELARRRGYDVGLRVKNLERLLELGAEGDLHTPTGRRRLSTALEALAHEDHLPPGDAVAPDAELFSISAPIYGPDGKMILAIALLPGDAYRGRDVPRLARAVVRVAQRVTSSVDGRAPRPTERASSNGRRPATQDAGRRRRRA